MKDLFFDIFQAAGLDAMFLFRHITEQSAGLSLESRHSGSVLVKLELPEASFPDSTSSPSSAYPTIVLLR